MKVLVTGGCGFLGTNLVTALSRRGDRVVALDSFARAGSERNRDVVAQLSGVEVVEGDVCDPADVAGAFSGCDAIVHLAAQVAVTTSVVDPVRDFDVNARGTLNVLEAARTSGRQPPVVFASTNKVYGGMEDAGVVLRGERYAYADLPHGVPESTPLDFHSPYGCSKGAGDQYVRDYQRIYGLPTAVFRMSCLYGPHQFGNEDQGWLAHFAISALRGEPVTIFGDGMQVRDVLFVDDVVDLYVSALDRGPRLRGEILNIGGGPDRTLTLLELIAMLEARIGREMDVSFAEWRPGDQRVYVSDIRRAAQEVGWTPTAGVEDGVGRLVDWISEQPYLVG